MTGFDDDITSSLTRISNISLRIAFMAGKYLGIAVLIKRIFPSVMTIHCIGHRQHLQRLPRNWMNLWPHSDHARQQDEGSSIESQTLPEIALCRRWGVRTAPVAQCSAVTIEGLLLHPRAFAVFVSHSSFEVCGLCLGQKWNAIIIYATKLFHIYEKFHVQTKLRIRNLCGLTSSNFW